MKLKILITTLLTIALVIGLMTYNFVWFRSSRISASYLGNPTNQVRVYTHGDDIYITTIPGSAWAYLIRGRVKFVGVPSKFLIITRFFAISKTCPVLPANLQSGKFDNHDPQLNFAKKSVSFVDLAGNPIVLSW